MNGRVKVTFPNDDCYDGEWKDGMENGSGKKIYSISGEVYVGEWKEGKCNGRGKYSYGGGEVYDGEWKEDKCNGTGIYIYIYIYATRRSVRLTPGWQRLQGRYRAP